MYHCGVVLLPMSFPMMHPKPSGSCVFFGLVIGVLFFFFLSYPQHRREWHEHGSPYEISALEKIPNEGSLLAPQFLSLSVPFRWESDSYPSIPSYQLAQCPHSDPSNLLLSRDYYLLGRYRQYVRRRPSFALNTSRCQAGF